MPNFSGAINRSIPLRRMSRSEFTGEPAFYGPTIAQEAAAGGGGRDQAADFQKQMAGLYGVIATVNTALTTMANVIKTSTTQALMQESRARGELSKALQTQVSFSAAAQFASAIPLVGGALGGLIQAGHESRQQQLGTRHMAAAAGIFEGRIPGQQQALESSGFRVAAGRIRERFAADPEREGLESARLGIRGGDLSRQLEGLLGGRTLIGGVVAQREAALTAANARLAGTPAPSGNWAPSSGDARFEAGRGVEIARERLTQAQALQASLFSPAARAFEKAGTAGLAEEEEIAGKDYLRAYSLRLAPQVGQSFASFGQGPGAPSGVPGKSGEVMNVRIISMDAEVRRALDGVNSLPP